jgi:hypothetical protein
VNEGERFAEEPARTIILGLCILKVPPCVNAPPVFAKSEYPPAGLDAQGLKIKVGQADLICKEPAVS